jgi:hypothetical protein
MVEPVVVTDPLYRVYVEALAQVYAYRGRRRGIYYLEQMARLYARVGRVTGSTEDVWVTKVPEGTWAVQHLDYRIVAQLCDYLGCSPSDLGL